MKLATLIPVIVQASVFLSVFGIGLKASARDATYLFRRPGELIPALLAMNLIMPLFAVGLVLRCHLAPAVEIALVALALCPVPPILPNKMRKAGAKDSYAVGLPIAVAAVAIVFVPAAIEVLELVFHVPLHMSVAAVAKLVGLTVLVPAGLGILVHSFAPIPAERLARPVSAVAGLALAACAIVLLIVAAPAVWDLIGNGTVLALAAFALVGLAIGHLVGGPDPGHRVALALGTASRHPGLAIVIAQTNFPEQKQAMAAVLLFVLVNTLVSMPYLAWMKRQVV
jgi:BASS family bile acid:Na+ symporter